MRALVTGASGFTGRHLVQWLHTCGCEVFSLGRTRVPDVTHLQLEDIHDFEQILASVRIANPDYLFHLAGTSIAGNLAEIFDVNVIYGANLLAALDAEGLAGKTRVMIMGSAAEYGVVSEKDMPISESMSSNPYNYYGISKLAQTQMALAWGCEDRRVVVVRPFTIMGPGMPTHLAIGDFVEQIRSAIGSGGNGELVTGNLNVSRDFLHVGDAVELCWRLANTNEAFGRVVNLCSGQPLKLQSMVEYLLQLTDCKISLKQSEDRMRHIDMKTHYGDNTRLIDLVGAFQFTPWRVSLKQILERL